MPVIQRLLAYHDRESFRCGNSDLDDFLHGLDPETTAWHVWVLVPDKDSPQILAYYAAAPEPTHLIFQNENGEWWSEHAVWLRYLGTDYRHVKLGYGTRLLLHLMRHIVLAADGKAAASPAVPVECCDIYAFPEETPEEPTIEWLFIQSVDEKARDWYLRRDLGLECNSQNSLSLHITLADMRALFSPDPIG